MKLRGNMVRKKRAKSCLPSRTRSMKDKKRAIWFGFWFGLVGWLVGYGIFDDTSAFVLFASLLHCTYVRSLIQDTRDIRIQK
ncbi:hypothetical protein GE21DRAFT_1070285 [Neurospora crassa]|nr:hypothetical protein GE21DRAFT_1070285 [Neurospora crassa]